MVYTKQQVDISFKALNELSEAFNRDKDLQKRFVLTGGWAPYFISLGKFDHTGSRDIDLVLSLELMKVYPSVEKLLTEKLKYEQSGAFEFKRTDDQVEFEVHFLCEPEHNPLSLKTYRIQSGVSPVVISGCSIAFEDNFMQKLDKTEILVSGPVASISLKAHAFDNNSNRIKDPYDIYSIMISVDDIDSRLSKWKIDNPFVEESIELLRKIFDSETSDGPTAAAEYLIQLPSERAAYAARVFTTLDSILRKIH
jgi:hypothetical protein